jgi:F-type H+-transporting ATPase subunit b
MIIDWYTILFQIINFLILVFLLRYFLYGPIVKAMDERERRIVEREEEAEARRNEAEKEAKDFRHKSQKLDESKEELMEEARSSAEEEKAVLLNKARSEVSETRRRWEEAFEREKESFTGELRRRIGKQACAVARRCLEDLADAKLEELTWNLFAGKLEELPEDDRQDLLKGIQDNDYKLNLLSAFETPKERLQELEKTLVKVLPDSEKKLNLSAKKDSALICGLELEAGGYRISWSVDSYLGDIEAEILKELDQSGPVKNEAVSDEDEVENNEEVPSGDE